MSFGLYVIILTYTMALLGIAATALVETISPAFVVFLGIAAVASLFVNLRRLRLVPAWVWNIIAFAIFVFFIADYAILSRNLLVSASRFLAVLMVSKLFDLKTNRDYIITYALVFFQILAAAASTVSISFLGILVLFLVSGIWAMIILNIRRDWAVSSPLSDEPPGRVFGPRFLAFVIASAAAALVITVVLFFAMPRAGLGFLERKTANTVKVTGFSDTVDLGELGEVKTDRTVVMRVGIRGGRPNVLIHFRGAALDHYDGARWTRRVKKTAQAPRSGSGRFIIGSSEERLLEQEILLEPLDADVLIAASNVMFIDGKFNSLRVDPSGTLYLPTPPYSRLEYVAWSDILNPRAAPDSALVFDEYKETSFLDTDPSGPGIRALTAEVTKGARDERAAATAIEVYLKNTYEYSLDPPHTEGKTPLEDFLFYSKKGYCEHYATAMTVMLRAAGIPSRLVTGFLEGEWNGLGNYYIVRQENAHSWVEAYIKGRGWTTFDPTPGEGLGSIKIPSTLSLYIDLIRWKWNRNIIHFTLMDQFKMAAGIERGLHSYIGALKKAFSWEKNTTTDGRWMLPKAVLTSGILVIIIAAVVIIMRMRSTAHGRADGRKTPRFYVEMMRLLKRRGIERMPGETPAEFARRLDIPAVYAITASHEARRYGERELTRAELEKLERDLREIKKTDETQGE